MNGVIRVIWSIHFASYTYRAHIHQLPEVGMCLISRDCMLLSATCVYTCIMCLSIHSLGYYYIREMSSYDKQSKKFYSFPVSYIIDFLCKFGFSIKMHHECLPKIQSWFFSRHSFHWKNHFYPCTLVIRWSIFSYYLSEEVYT